MAKRGKKTKKRPASGTKRPRPTLADAADRMVLYEEAVQAPEVDVRFLEGLFESSFSDEPKRLREDFCGGAAVCCAWVQQGEQREAWGVDIDAATLAWGRDNNLARMRESERNRVHLVEADVRSSGVDAVDLICAQNFSYCVFHTRAELLDYFRRCYVGLAARGLFVVDLFGGYESIEDDREDVTDHDDFYYVWEQHRYDPINARGIYKIHFRFPDGSALEDAFVYDWRLWTIPEVREVMIEAGFDRADVYWEEEDPETHEGTGTYTLQTSGDCDPAWNAYIVGAKLG